jgi:predicted alpha/beta-hydrolase family hydrolase
MTEYPTHSANAPTLVLAHGAGAGQDHPWMVRAAKGLAARGIRILTFNFPYKESGRSAPDPGAVLEEAFQTAWRGATHGATGRLFAGGKSMGGRIASQAAARGLFEPAASGLVFFGYPLHPPGKPDQRRDRHLTRIQLPMLFLHGTRDPFGSPEEMQALAEGLPIATLHLIEGGDHSLVSTKRADPSGQSIEGALDIAAEFMKR